MEILSFELTIYYNNSLGKTALLYFGTRVIFGNRIITIRGLTTELPGQNHKPQEAPMQALPVL